MLSDLKADYWTKTDIYRIARRIWWGKFPRTDDKKWTDLPSVGINGRRAIYLEMPTYRWFQIDDFEIFLEAQVRGAFRGMILVKRIKQ